ncbi:hypothetical protein [Glaciimonas soli]|uniref:Lipoprotein n=1 Tax=Glaciimonas soli TaxID=2590999 RepID=A0A843YLI9_9BURK|nr:hypothetical protein [Glaciimonas soli]MQQ99789.1 hypothetical protein [Glaciimonas soli]
MQIKYQVGSAFSMVCVVMALAGCQSQGASATGVHNEHTPLVPAPQPEQPGLSSAFLQTIKQDLSKRTGIPDSAINVLKVENKQWSDGALGCPKPGQMYMQMIIDGYTVQLQVKDMVYEYHTDQGNSFVSC